MSLQSDVIKWQEYLRSERGYSNHTIVSYRHDIEDFISFIKHHKRCDPMLHDIIKMDIHTIRSWLSMRKQSDYAASSISRALSGIKSFYKFIYQVTGESNPAVLLMPVSYTHLTLPTICSV